MFVYYVKPIHMHMKWSEITKPYMHEWNRRFHTGFALTCLKGLFFILVSKRTKHGENFKETSS